jgi:NAD(P)-dependent dehydrogenase (short-subunit alcohol dehydrogenase family)
MLQERIIIVTGASRGLGRHMVQALAEQGAVVVAAARRLVSAQDPPSGAALAVAVDVRDQTQVRQLVQQVLDRYGRVDVLVNNAGLMVGDVSFTDTTPALWRDILDTNLWGAFLCCWAVLPAMRRQGGGVIVNISSGAAVRTGFLNVPYGVSKAGLDRLTLGLGTELKPYGIACISLSPSVSATDTVRRMYPDRQVDTWAQPPELPARALCALLADDPLQYTGQVLSVRDYLTRKGLLPAP